MLLWSEAGILANELLNKKTLTTEKIEIRPSYVLRFKNFQTYVEISFKAADKDIVSYCKPGTQAIFSVILKNNYCYDISCNVY